MRNIFSFFYEILQQLILPIVIGRLAHLTYNQVYILFLMPVVYILFSPSSNRFYTGATSAEVELRLEKHLREHYGSAYTSSAKDWEIYLQISCE